MTLSREMNVSSRSNSSFHIRLSNDGSQLNALPEDDLSPERIQQLMAQFDSSSSEAIKNLHLHATHSGLANAGPALRQAGLLPLLVNVLSQSEQSKEGQETDQASIRAMSADVLATITTDDVSSADLLIRLDIVKTLCCKGCIDSHSLGKGMTLTTSSLQLLLVIIRQLTPGSR